MTNQALRKIRKLQQSCHRGLNNEPVKAVRNFNDNINTKPKISREAIRKNVNNAKNIVKKNTGVPIEKENAVPKASIKRSKSICKAKPKTTRKSTPKRSPKNADKPSPKPLTARPNIDKSRGRNEKAKTLMGFRKKDNLSYFLSSALESMKKRNSKFQNTTNQTELQSANTINKTTNKTHKSVKSDGTNKLSKSPKRSETLNDPPIDKANELVPIEP